MNNSELVQYVIMPLAAAGIGAIGGAVLAFRYQRTSELKRDKRAVIQNLMIYRNVGAHELEWIKSLNAIDIVFNKDKEVKNVYHRMLAQMRPPFFQSGHWVETFYQLIFEMGKCSDYKNLTMLEIREYYSPNALDIHYPNMNVGSEPKVLPSTDMPSITKD